MRLLKVIKAPFGWRIEAGQWCFEGASAERVQAKAREVFPDAIFLVYFYGPRPFRRLRKRIRPEVA